MRCKGSHFILNNKHLMFFYVKEIGFIRQVDYLCKVVSTIIS